MRRPVLDRYCHSPTALGVAAATYFGEMDAVNKPLASPSQAACRIAPPVARAASADYSWFCCCLRLPPVRNETGVDAHPGGIGEKASVRGRTDSEAPGTTGFSTRTLMDGAGFFLEQRPDHSMVRWPAANTW
jgi:hypothetical protein